MSGWSSCPEPGCDRMRAHPGPHLSLERRPLRSTPPPPPAESYAAGMAGSETGARKWTPLEQLAVDRAIWRVAARGQEFTADDVWLEVGDAAPVTKGLAGRLNRARNAGLIESTDRVAFSQRKGEHGHGQRLAVWRPK